MRRLLQAERRSICRNIVIAVAVVLRVLLFGVSSECSEAEVGVSDYRSNPGFASSVSAPSVVSAACIRTVAWASTTQSTKVASANGFLLSGQIQPLAGVRPG
jgi:hypothetical protein